MLSFTESMQYSKAPSQQTTISYFDLRKLCQGQPQFHMKIMSHDCSNVMIENYRVSNVNLNLYPFCGHSCSFTCFSMPVLISWNGGSQQLLNVMITHFRSGWRCVRSLCDSCQSVLVSYRHAGKLQYLKDRFGKFLVVKAKKSIYINLCGKHL